MCNYQPIYIRSYGGIFYFASLPEVLEERNFLDNVTTNDFKVTAVPPYSAISFQDDEVETYEMERKKNNKCLVICSGGLDSTVASAMLQKQGYDIIYVSGRETYVSAPRTHVSTLRTYVLRPEI